MEIACTDSDRHDAGRSAALLYDGSVQHSMVDCVP